jgi:hypothetical protein
VAHVGQEGALGTATSWALSRATIAPASRRWIWREHADVKASMRPPSSSCAVFDARASEKAPAVPRTWVGHLLARCRMRVGDEPLQPRREHDGHPTRPEHDQRRWSPRSSRGDRSVLRVSDDDVHGARRRAFH